MAELPDLKLKINKMSQISKKDLEFLTPEQIKSFYNGHEPFKVVGIRENQVELEGDFSGGTHNVSQKDWFDDDMVFVVKEVCEEQLKPNDCQRHNIHCCGGGSIITEHLNYWDDLLKID